MENIYLNVMQLSANDARLLMTICGLFPYCTIWRVILRKNRFEYINWASKTWTWLKKSLQKKTATNQWRTNLRVRVCVWFKQLFYNSNEVILFKVFKNRVKPVAITIKMSIVNGKGIRRGKFLKTTISYCHITYSDKRNRFLINNYSEKIFEYFNVFMVLGQEYPELELDWHNNNDFVEKITWLLLRPRVN